MRKIILASASPRRSSILREMGYNDFTVEPADVTEIVPDAENYYCAALDNALLKARYAAEKHPECIVIGADTLIELDSGTLGKPENIADAWRMLRLLSGRVHFVATGVAVICKELDLTVKFTERTGVRFRKLTDEAINEYLSKVNILDKAGAYAVQECGELIIDSLDGSVTNVIGLPSERLSETLKHVLSL